MVQGSKASKCDIEVWQQSESFTKVAHFLNDDFKRKQHQHHLNDENMDLVRSFDLCSFIYVFYCNEIMNDLNFFAIIGAFHVHVLFRCDRINN